VIGLCCRQTFASSESIVDQRFEIGAVHLDASALVKRYVAARSSRETVELSATADVVATSVAPQVCRLTIE
jgi:hypothetical protein